MEGILSHQAYPAEVLGLRDGTQVMVRAIRPDDAPRLQALLGRLSPQTIYLRVLAPLSVLPDAYARYLVKVDYHKRMALVATREPEGSDDVIGVARYAVTGSIEEAKAELAIVVEDAYQNRGLGTLLLARLAAYARAHGITAFAATVLSQNTRVFHLITRSGLPAERHSRTRGEVEVFIPLSRGSSSEHRTI